MRVESGSPAPRVHCSGQARPAIVNPHPWSPNLHQSSPTPHTPQHATQGFWQTSGIDDLILVLMIGWLQARGLKGFSAAPTTSSIALSHQFPACPAPCASVSLACAAPLPAHCSQPGSCGAGSGAALWRPGSSLQSLRPQCPPGPHLSSPLCSCRGDTPRAVNGSWRQGSSECGCKLPSIGHWALKAKNQVPSCKGLIG